MRFVTLEEHTSDNKSPIIIKKGIRVRVGEQSDDAGSWPNWIYCYSLEDTGEGWTPRQIVQTEREYGVALEDYSAKELEVEKGELVEGDKEMNGWVWCKKMSDLEEGWMPKEKLMALK